jgi:hypothetical protein
MTFLDQEVPTEKEIARRIAPYGDTDRGIRKSKPDDNGLIQWIWRWCRFHGGNDMSMPVTAEFWLKDWLENKGILPEFNGENGTERRKIVSEVTSELDSVVKKVLREEFGKSDFEAAKRWKRAGLM